MNRPFRRTIAALALGGAVGLMVAAGGRADGPGRLPALDGGGSPTAWEAASPPDGVAGLTSAAGSSGAPAAGPSLPAAPSRGVTSPGSGVAATSAALDGTILGSVLLPGGDQQVTLYDTKRQTLLVYRIDARDGRLQLRSARRITWDLEVESLASENPSPAQVRAMAPGVGGPLR